MELEQLRQLVVAMVRREEVGCASGSGGGVYDTVGEDDDRAWEEAENRQGDRS